VAPPLVCGDVAVTEFDEPTITVLLNGAVDDCELTASVSPAGDVWKLRTTVCGSRRTVCVAVVPKVSVAVRLSSRYDGYS